MANFVEINGMPLPTPSHDSGKYTTSTMVNTGRNANGQVIGQRVGRDISKLELTWSYLPTNTWRDILKVISIDPMNLLVKYYDHVEGQYITREMYVGNRSAKPYSIHKDGTPTFMVDCSLNLIDKGK